MRVRAIDAALGRLLDETFGRAFGGKLHPIEIYHALWRAVEDGRIISAGASYVPNRLEARLNPADFAALEGITSRLVAEFQAALRDDCRSEGYEYGAQILVRLVPDQRVRRAHVDVSARLDESPIPASLRAESGAHAGQVWELTPGVLLGRSGECHIVLADQAVSRRHCRFDWVFAGYRVVDLGSTNGTYVNDVQVAEYVLSDHDLLGVGTTRLRFQYDLARAWVD